MEFKYRDGQIRRTSTPPPPPPPPLPQLLSLPAVAFVSRYPLRRGGIPSTMLPSRVFPTLTMSADELRRQLEIEQIRRELEKEEIRREIIAGEMARRQGLEEEVRWEMASERAMRIPIKREDEITFNDSLINHRMLGGGLPFHLPSLPRDHIKHISTQPQNKEDGVIILNKPDVDSCGLKRKATTPTVDGSQRCSFSLEKKCKKQWNCALCQVTATSEKGLKDHLEGKKHKAKEVSLQEKKNGLESRSDMTTPVDTCKLASKEEEEQAVQKCNDLGGLDNQNEMVTGNEAEKANALTTRKRFKFWCAFCEVGTGSEVVMQSHKNGKKHLTNVNKLKLNNDGVANS